jgi:septum formation protein
MVQKSSHTSAVILASASPRRRDLLAQLGVSFTVAPADIDEGVAPEETPQDYVRRMAIGKAQAGYAQAKTAGIEPGFVVLGADTSVVVGKYILGKPQHKADAIRMLELLSGRTHLVLSAVAVTDGQRVEDRISTTEVSFRNVSPTEAAAYWVTGEPCDKAGAYAVQGLGALFVQELKGSYTGIVGLPLYETAGLLALFGCRFGLEPG